MQAYRFENEVQVRINVKVLTKELLLDSTGFYSAYVAMQNKSHVVHES